MRRRSIAARDVALPTSSSVVNSTSIDGRGGAENVRERAQRQERRAEARLHVEDAGPEQPPVLLGAASSELADRPDRVEVPEEQDAAAAAGELGQDVVAAAAAVQALDRAAERRQAARELVAAAIDRGLVRARRLERDELSTVSRAHAVSAAHHAWRSSDIVERLIISGCVTSRRCCSPCARVERRGSGAEAAAVPEAHATRRNRIRRARAAVAPPQKPGAPVDAAAPTEAALGVPIYPRRSSSRLRRRPRPALLPLRHQRDVRDIVEYYRTALKQRGELVYDEPPVHMFDVGRFREETMAFPPGVTVKDYTLGRLGRVSQPEARRRAGAVQDDHSDRAGAGVRRLAK